ncbi:MAG: DMT family transporter [Candidatus Omnitrophica bacterium]|nr:DMT family transporter [Candidatus Omnitrophota bacterium]
MPPRHIAVWTMVGSAMVFAVMSALLRHASYLTSYQASFFRFTIGLAILGSMALFGKIKLEFSQHLILFSRGFFGGIGVFLFFFSIQKIGLGEGTVLSYTFPVFGTIASAIYLKEKVNLKQWLLIFLSFFGIYLISHQGEGWLFRISLYHWVALLGALSSGIAVVFIKKARSTNSAYTIYLSQCLVGFWLVILPASLEPLNIRLGGGLILVAIGLCSAVAQLMMTHAYGYLSVSAGSTISMLVPVFNLLLGVLLFRESFSLKIALGATLVIVSCSLMLKAQETPTPP